MNLDKIIERLDRHKAWDYSPLSGLYAAAISRGLPALPPPGGHPGSRRRPPTANMRRARRRATRASRQRNRS